MSEGVDYSWARPGGAALAAAGETFAVRYLYPGGGKGLTVEEVNDLHIHGIAVAVVFESSANRALAGHGAGASDAQVAQGQLAACGLPGDLPIYFGVDFDATDAQLAQIYDYLDGAGTIIGKNRVGVYGSYEVTTHCRSVGSASWGWQTYAWSGGQVDAGANLYQYLNGQNINGGVDLVKSFTADFGQSIGASSGSGSGVASLPGSVAVGSNMTSKSTKWVQDKLNVFGYVLVSDGQYGPATTAAVHAFEIAQGLAVDIGIAGPQVEAALANGPAAPAAPAAPAPGALAVDGVRGDLTIKAEQNALGVAADGSFGPISIEAEQGHVGATQDGKRGKLTIEALQRHLGVKPADGVEGPQTIRAEQTALNNGSF